MDAGLSHRPGAPGGFQDRGAAVFGLLVRLPSLNARIKITDHQAGECAHDQY